MGFFSKLRRQKVGAPPSAGIINDGIAAAEYMNRLRVTPPMQLKHMPGGPLIGPPVMNKGYLAVANSNIPARSGSAAGVGSVKIVQVQATFSGGAMTACTLTTSTIVLPVYYASSNTMTSGNGIDSGMYCWAQQDGSGFYSVAPLECS